MNYCQDGLWVTVSETIKSQIYQNIQKIQLSGHYKLNLNNVNGRPYFNDKRDIIGIWWDGIDSWWFGLDVQKGESFGFAYYEKDSFCPHQLSEWDWRVKDGTDTWIEAHNGFGITCKPIFVQTKQSGFHIKRFFFHGIRQLRRLYWQQSMWRG